MHNTLAHTAQIQVVAAVVPEPVVAVVYRPTANPYIVHNPYTLSATEPII